MRKGTQAHGLSPTQKASGLRWKLPALKENPNITRIMWVDADNHSRQVVYWQRQTAIAPDGVI